MAGKRAKFDLTEIFNPPTSAGRPLEFIRIAGKTYTAEKMKNYLEAVQAYSRYVHILLIEDIFHDEFLKQLDSIEADDDGRTERLWRHLFDNTSAGKHIKDFYHAPLRDMRAAPPISRATTRMVRHPIENIASGGNTTQRSLDIVGKTQDNRWSDVNYKYQFASQGRQNFRSSASKKNVFPVFNRDGSGIKVIFMPKNSVYGFRKGKAYLRLLYEAVGRRLQTVTEKDFYDTAIKYRKAMGMPSDMDVKSLIFNRKWLTKRSYFRIQYYDWRK